MTTILMLCLWSVAISGWFTVFHLWQSGVHNQAFSSVVIVRCVIASIIALALGCFTIAAINTIGAYHSAFSF